MSVWGLRFRAGAALSLLLSGAALAGLKDADCLECHSDNTLVKTNAAGRAISLFVDPARLAASAHRTNTCASCHADITEKHPDDNVAAQRVDCARCHSRQSSSYGASVHGLALKAGQTETATLRVQERYEAFDLAGAYAISIVLASMAVLVLVALTVVRPREEAS